MTSSWELPSNSPRKVVRVSAPASVDPPTSSLFGDRLPAPLPPPPRPRKATSRWTWFLLAALAFLPIAGAGAASYYVYSSRRDLRFEKQCRALREARQWRQLQQVSLKWLVANPRNLKGVFFAAQSSEKLGEFDEAVKLLLAAPRNQEHSSIALAEAAEMQFSKLNRPLEAIQNFEEALKLNPKEIDSRHRLIFFYAMTMQRKKMNDHILEAIRLGVESREHYVYLVGSEWLIFSNGPQYNFLWRTSDPENEHFNVARALGVVANGYVTPPEQALASGEKPPYLLTGDNGVDPDAPEGTQARAAHYESILRAYLEKYPKNIELLSYFLSRAVAAGDAKSCEFLLSELPQEALEDGRFWRYKASWQLILAKTMAVSSPQRAEKLRKAVESLQEARRLNPYDMTSMHQLAGILREMGETRKVEELEAIATEGSEIRRLVLQSDSAAIGVELFDRIRSYVALCGQSDVADAMAKRLQMDKISSDELLKSH